MILNKIKSKSHHAQSIWENSVHKLLYSDIQFLETHCTYTIIKTYESTISIMQLYNLAKLRQWKNKYIYSSIFLKLNPPFHNYLGKSPHVNSPPFKMKKTPTPSKNF